MGGTEMEQALQAAVQIPGPSIPQDFLLITDGEVWQSEEIIGRIRKSEHRVFTVGVGSAVSEGFVRQLAQTTGGACELVAPNEQMTDKIVRHFRRMYLPRADKVVLRWPQDPIQVIPRTIGPVYDGDTVHVFARFSEMPKGPVILAVTLADGSTLEQIVNQDDVESPMVGDDLSGPGPLTRMAIGQTLNELDTTEAAALAVRYQLISRHTNYLVVDVRAEGEQGEQLPVLRKVPQMLAAGWGGTGTIVCKSSQASALVDSVSEYDSGIRYSRAPSPQQRYRWRQQTTPSSFIYNCNRRHTRWLRPVLEVTSYDDLGACELPERILDAISSIAKQITPEPSEQDVALAFLCALLQSPAGGLFDRTTKRTIKKWIKKSGVDAHLLELMRAAFAEISERDWGPNYPLIEEEEGDDD